MPALLQYAPICDEFLVLVRQCRDLMQTDVQDLNLYVPAVRIVGPLEHRGCFDPDDFIAPIDDAAVALNGQLGHLRRASSQLSPDSRNDVRQVLACLIDTGYALTDSLTEITRAARTTALPSPTIADAR